MATIDRREFVKFLGASAASAGLSGQLPFAAPALTERPNLLFILTDDLGYGDLSVYGRPDYQTPNLDALAAEGTRFTDAYAAFPVCTPTRTMRRGEEPTSATTYDTRTGHNGVFATPSNRKVSKLGERTC